MVVDQTERLIEAMNRLSSALEGKAAVETAKAVDKAMAADDDFEEGLREYENKNKRHPSRQV